MRPPLRSSKFTPTNDIFEPPNNFQVYLENGARISINKDAFAPGAKNPSKGIASNKVNGANTPNPRTIHIKNS